MSHVIFALSVVSFFSCLFSLVLTLVMVGHGRKEQTYLPRAFLVVSFLLLMCSEVADAYLLNISIARRDWIYELQEMAVVVMIPALSFFTNTTLRPRRRTALNAVFAVFGSMCLIVYVYGNFLNTGVWEYAYTVYGSGLVLTILYASLTLIIRADPPVGIAAFFRRIVGATTLVLTMALVLVDIDLVLTEGPILLIGLDALIIPLICLLWSVAFVADDLKTLTKGVGGGSAFDMAAIRDRYELSPREYEVMQLLLEGRRYDEIGEALFIAKATVKTYIFRIYQKVGVNSKMQLVNKLLQTHATRARPGADRGRS